MQIIQHLTDARLPIETVLQPVAQTLGLELHHSPNGMAKLTAEVGNPIGYRGSITRGTGTPL
jgi:hypothetical protein